MIEGVEITSFARLFQFKTPFFGFSWLKPEKFQVRAPDGRLRYVNVRDRTRLVQVALTILITFAGWLILNATNSRIES
mgnify:FL=1